MAESLLPLLPKNELETELEAADEVVDAMEEYNECGDGSEVIVVDDVEIGDRPVVELEGPSAALNFRVATELPVLVVYAKSVQKFFSLCFDLYDRDERHFSIDFSTRRSMARVHKQKADLPLILRPDGWQYLKFDLRHILRSAFGADYLSCVGLTVRAACRIFRIYFADSDVPDFCLPNFLRILQN